MVVFLVGLTVFNLCLAGLSVLLGARMGRAEGRARWASLRLYGLGAFIAWSSAAVALAACGWGWWMFAAHPYWAMLALAAPPVWLLAMGVVFAAADFAEDGVLGNALKPQGPIPHDPIP